MFTNDLAISAVSYDTLLVGEMMTLMALRLGSTPAWMDASITVDGLPSANLDDGASRLVLVLWQRLWGLDDVTAAEAVALRVRVRRAPRSVVVVTLDDAALPVWLARARCRSLSWSDPSTLRASARARVAGRGAASGRRRGETG